MNVRKTIEERAMSRYHIHEHVDGFTYGKLIVSKPDSHFPIHSGMPVSYILAVCAGILVQRLFA